MTAARNTSLPARWSLPRGHILHRALRADPTQEYLLYVPHSVPTDPRVLVSVHGISRNAPEQAAVFSPLCEERGLVMLVPIFAGEQHQDYQRLGRKGRGIRVDLLLHQFLAEVGSLTGADVAQTYMFGFSAGAQFTHRYLMAHPHRVVRAVIAAAGWYTFPDPTDRFPYGVRPIRTLEGISFNPERFLRVPIEVLVGDRDTTIQNLRQTERTNNQQGLNRLERARNWVQAMRQAATDYGLEPRTTLTEVPDIDHSFAAFCEQGELVQSVGHSLFDHAESDPHLSIVPNDAVAKSSVTNPSSGDPSD